MNGSPVRYYLIVKFILYSCGLFGKWSVLLPCIPACWHGGSCDRA